MYYVELIMNLPDGCESHIGTSSTQNLEKAVSRLESFREVAESLVIGQVILSYELKLGTIPSALL